MLLDRGRIIEETVRRMARAGEAEGLLLQPYKKDRSVSIIRCGEGYEVFETGFFCQRIMVDSGKLKKLLKTICKREFPRSNKVWINSLSAEDSAKLRQRWI